MSLEQGVQLEQGDGQGQGVEQGGPAGLHAAGRAVAWLAKQAEVSLAEVDLSLAQFRVLGLLCEGAAVSSALSERLAVRPPSVTAVIDGLESRGLVERRTIEGDRRSVALVVTDEGRRTFAAAEAALDGRLRAIAEFLGDDDGGAGALEQLGRWPAALRAHHQASTEARR